MDSGHVAKRARTTPTAANGKPTASVNFTSEKLPFVTLTNAAGDSVKAYPFGACITSYVKGGKETLAMRADNKMDGSKPISGGIPHCFPQFGPGAMQQHGFARNCVWDVAEITDGPDSTAKVPSLQCPSSAPAPPHGGPGGSGRLETPRARGRATGCPDTALGARGSRLQSHQLYCL